MNNPLTKAQLRDALKPDPEAGSEPAKDVDLAKFFGISRAAIAQWPEHGPIPELRQLQLERKRPDLFDLPAAAPAEAA